MPQNIPLKLEELKRRRKDYIRELKGDSKNVTKLDKLALWITNKVGSMGFFVLIFSWTVLWLFISNMIQLFLLPLIMIGQNLQSQHAEVRADTDLKINELAEIENETILMHLENQNEMILEILKKIENRNNQSDGK